MQFLKAVFGNIWRFYFFTQAVVLFFLFFPFHLITLFLSKAPHRLTFKLMRINCKLILWCAGIFPKVKYEFTPDKNTTYVICPNHTSYLDILMTYVAIGNYFHFMGKAELEDVPCFNIFFKRMNIGVNRASKTASHKAYLRAVSDLQKGICIAIFPEATIPECTPEIGKFKNGAFKLAVENKVQIIPVTYHKNYRLLPDTKNYKHLGGRPGIAPVTVHKPIDSKNFSEEDLEQLKDAYRAVIKNALEAK